MNICNVQNRIRFREISLSHICRYHIAMTKLRSSSYTLEVECRTYTKPKTNICKRQCPVCNVIEDEIHFLANCKLYDTEMTYFFGKITAKIQNLPELNDADKFILLMSSKDKQIVVWTGKFIYECFNIRSRFYLNYGGVQSYVLYISYIPRDTMTQGIDLVLMLSWSVYWNTTAVIGINHDTVCTGVVCAATPGIARVGPAVARPLAASPAGPTSAVPGVAAQTTPAQTVWVVNFYSTTKTKQYTTINPATIMTMSRHAETTWLTMPLW